MRKRLIMTIVVGLVLALVLTWLMEWRYFLNDWGATWDFVFSRPRVFLFNAWLMGLILTSFSAVLGGLWRGAGATGAVVLIVSYINASKFLVRGVPLLPEDLQLASEVGALASFVDVASIFGLIGAIVVWLVVMFAIARGWHKWLGYGVIRGYRKIVLNVVIVVVAMGALVGGSAFVWHHNGAKYQDVEWLETTFTAWDQTKNYDENGFLIGFLYNWGKFEVSEPEGYSEERINNIREELEEKASRQLSVKQPDYNIIIVLNESFINWAKVEEYYPHSGGDVTPNLHKIMAKNPSGYTYSVDYGGGTANVEFEAVTGLTNYWMQTVPYTNLIPKSGEIPSYASWAKENGYETAAVHSFNGGMYKRNISLANEGFDEFITMGDFKHQDKEAGSEYVNDRSCYAEVLDRVKEKEEKQFILTITMQNHTPYGENGGEFVLDAAPSGDEGRKDSIEKYLTALHGADEYLGELIAEVDKLKEKTVVLFFGDHAPGVLWELDSSEDEAEVALSRATPYFIHANFEIAENGENKNLPTTTPNCLVNTMLNRLHAKKPLIGYMLDKVCSEVPILTPRYLGGSDAAESKDLQDYMMITYDILSGEKYFVKK